VIRFLEDHVKVIIRVSLFSVNFDNVIYKYFTLFA